MTNASNHEDHAAHVARRPSRRRSTPIGRTSVAAALVGLAILAAGCGGSSGTGTTGSSSGGAMARALAYARCMRSHGIADFPDPVTPPGGGVAFSVHGGPGSDLNPSNPRFTAADQACRALSPAGEQPPAPSAAKLAAGVRWARCLRSHGVPGFPDPDSQGAFDSGRFDTASPAFQTASSACGSLQPKGSISAVPGRP
jgi:hypothetical protein